MELPLPPLWNYFIMTVIGIISFKVAWGVSPGGKYGSIINWAVGLLTLSGLWLISCAIIKVVCFIAANWVIFVCLGIIAATTAIVVTLEILRRNNDA